MKMTTTVALSNMRYQKSKNILIGIAITLTTLLLFLIPTLGTNIITSQFAAINELYPTWHGLFRQVDEETVSKLAAHHNIDSYGLRSDVAILDDVVLDATFIYLDELGQSMYKLSLFEGDYPSSEKEVAVSQSMLEQLGITATIGDSITLPYQLITGDGLILTKEETFTISGFLSPPQETSESHAYTMLVSKNFLETHLSSNQRTYRFLLQTTAPDDATTEEIEAIIYEIGSQFHISEADTAINSEYLFANYVDPLFIPTIIAIMVIVIFAGIITTYSIYYIGMSEQIRSFGKLKSLGATKGQLRSIVLKEGLFIGCIAVPIGLILATFLSPSIFILMLDLMKENNTFVQKIIDLMNDGKLTLFHGWIYGIAVFISFTTIFLALLHPMKVVGSISDIEAIRFQEEKPTKKKSRNSLSDIRLHHLAILHLKQNKKRTFLTVLSMCITGIFLMVIATVLSCANPLESANSSILSQYQILLTPEEQNQEYPERAWNQIIKNNPLNAEFIESISSLDTVKDVVTLTQVNALSDAFPDELISLSGYPKEFEKELLDGIVEGSITYEELHSGKKVILDANYLKWYPDLSIGDEILISIKDSAETHTVEIAAIGEYSHGFSYYSMLLSTEEGLSSLTADNINYSLLVYADENHNQELEDQIIQLLDNSPILGLRTWQDEYDTWNQSLNFTKIGSYTFLGILSLICIMNMINTMIHSVNIRKKEFAMLQALGMTQRQLKHVLQLEGLFYTLATAIFTIGIGSLLGYPVYLFAKANHMFNITNYHYPIEITLFICIVLFVTQALLSLLLSRISQKESLIERIRL